MLLFLFLKKCPPHICLQLQKQLLQKSLLFPNISTLNGIREIEKKNITEKSSLCLQLQTFTFLPIFYSLSCFGYLRKWACIMFPAMNINTMYFHLYYLVNTSTSFLLLTDHNSEGQSDQGTCLSQSQRHYELGDQVNWNLNLCLFSFTTLVLE